MPGRRGEGNSVPEPQGRLEILDAQARSDGKRQDGLIELRAPAVSGNRTRST
jgi:hypothetical protein